MKNLALRKKFQANHLFNFQMTNKLFWIKKVRKTLLEQNMHDYEVLMKKKFF